MKPITGTLVFEKEYTGWREDGTEVVCIPGFYEVIDHQYGYPDKPGAQWLDLMGPEGEVSVDVAALLPPDCDTTVEDPVYRSEYECPRWASYYVEGRGELCTEHLMELALEVWDPENQQWYGGRALIVRPIRTPLFP